MKISKTLTTLGFAAAIAFLLTACAPTVNLEAAPLANDRACAEVSVRLPDLIDTQEKRVTNAQATAAWGQPSVVILRCGLEPIDVSTLSCVTATGVDWLVDDSESPSYRFITFGRSPAAEVIVDSTAIAGVTALDALSSAIKNIEATKTCSE
jgi:hypothetical protein